MASHKDSIPGGEKASGIDNKTTHALRTRRDTRREGIDRLDRTSGAKRRKTWLIDGFILLLIVGLGVGVYYAYSFLRDKYAPTWEERQVVYVLELTEVDPEMVAYESSGEKALCGKDVYASMKPGADQLGRVTEAVRVQDAENPDCVTLYLTIEATARYRAERGYWMADTRLLCGETRVFRLAGLEVQGRILSLQTREELESLMEATETESETVTETETESAGEP